MHINYLATAKHILSSRSTASHILPVELSLKRSFEHLAIQNANVRSPIFATVSKLGNTPKIVKKIIFCDFGDFPKNTPKLF